MSFSRTSFSSLILAVAISGMSQGLIIPLLTILLANRGISSLANGFNATALYLGILLASPWMDIPLRRLGYRKTLLIGLLLVTFSTLLFPLFRSYSIWFGLRFILGIGDVWLNYASQMWVTAISPPNRRGRNLSIYGLAYGLGFSIGPQGILLLPWGVFAPFLAISVIYVVAFILIGRLPNSYPESFTPSAQQENRYISVMRLAWIALLPAFLYGFMEATLNNSFPIYILRLGLAKDWIPLLLFTFTAGSLVLQLPLGVWSDRIGRQKVMLGCAAVGTLMFALFPLIGHSFWSMAILFAVAGGVVGSFYSLGMAFATDILQPKLVPTFGILAGIYYSLASILAPGVNGFILDHLPPGLIFATLALLLALFCGAGFFFRAPQLQSSADGS